MPRNRPTQLSDEWDGAGERAASRRKTARFVVPLAVAGVAAATIGLVPALASAGDPDLPKISAEALIAKIADSDTQQLSGTVKVSSDLGLPALPAGGAGGMFGSGAGGGGDKDGGGAASPEAKLTELASGTHTLRVAVDGPQKQRVSIIDKAAEYSMIHNADQVWTYDSGSNEAYHATAPKGASEEAVGKGGAGKDAEHKLPKGLKDATPQEFAKQALKAVGDTTSVTVDGTAKVAGQDAYQLVITPKQSESTVGSIRIAVDADNGVPLKFTLMPKSGGKAAVEAGFSSVDFAKPAASTFDFTPPKGAKVTEQKAADLGGSNSDSKSDKTDKAGPSGLSGIPGLSDLAEKSGSGSGTGSGVNVHGKGWASVAEIKGSGGGPVTKDGGKSPDAEKLLSSLGEKVKGDFGSGTVFSTRLVNALMTDDGTVYVGAVDKAGLLKVANAAK
ncbi:LolA family protein [Streptomyces sp. H27-D2]|uniref:LolA family protein n=1 Tax=Streptomyces sp. H27-D2 TaxID=3046304 RepID=UPI002DB6E3CF|nr:DUF2092 domain-containing protein [Streptomyces sp. H27-D2]MEC4020021.1 DUF2092 domain-containing protein [Streptomyces sp. H27-D2]